MVEAVFEFPYLAHATLEPQNAVARKIGDIIEIWGGHQLPDYYQNYLSKIAGTTPDKIKLHVMKTGGGFGRRGVFDADVLAEAVAVAKAVDWKYPVKVQWTRNNDMQAGRYRPAYVHTMKAGLDAKGNLIAWHNHVVGQSILAGTPFQHIVKNDVDPTSVGYASKLPYGVPNMKVELTTMTNGVPVLFWRSVGASHAIYAVEAFLDEVAEAAGKDPVAYRLALLEKTPESLQFSSSPPRRRVGTCRWRRADFVVSRWPRRSTPSLRRWSK